MTFKLYSVIILFITVTLNSCSNIKPVSPPPLVIAAPVVNLTQQEIMKLKMLEKYRLLRLAALKDDPTGAKRKKRYYRRMPPRKLRNPPTISNGIPRRFRGNSESITIEIDQNLTYFCMKHRKNYKFTNNKTCQSHTDKIAKQCMLKYKENDRRLVRCIKDKLKYSI